MIRIAITPAAYDALIATLPEGAPLWPGGGDASNVVPLRRRGALIPIDIDLLDHWQTLIAGILALLAGFGTVVATMIIARRQIAASREEADRVIAATREQTGVTAEQTRTTVRLEQMRDASEANAFHVMLEAAMARVLAEAAWARETYPQYFGAGPRRVYRPQGASVDALTVRQCITKGAFAELRAACVRQGSPLTGEFLDLEREIDSFAMQWEDKIVNAGLLIRWGKHAGLSEQLALIETKAAALREKAFDASERRI